MAKKTSTAMMTVLLASSMLILAFDVRSTRANTITVPHDYTTIQEAINQANEGDIILVRTGTYHENVIVNKTVSLFGENTATTIIDGDEIGDCVNVMASSVTISGFTIRNGGSSSGTAHASVRLLTSANSILENNLTGSWCGIWMERYSDSNLIANNTIVKNLNGIAGEKWHNTKIIGNTIENNLLGIWIGAYSQDNVISFNNIDGQLSEGIMMMASSNNTFEDNNIVDNNQGNFSAGITIGFQQGFSSGNRFFHNNIANVGKQIELQGESDMITWDDGYSSGGNYWSDYRGMDLYSGPFQNETNSDRIGDTPYFIDSKNSDRYPLIFPYGFVPSPDLTGDGEVDIRDLSEAALAFGSYPSNPKWKFEADMNQDSEIDIRDLIIIAKKFGGSILIQGVRIRTDKSEYSHLESVTIVMNYRTQAMQLRNVVLEATIEDELNVHVGIAMCNLTIGGSFFNQFKEYTSTLTITIPSWTFAGQAIVHVHFLQMLGSNGPYLSLTPESTLNIQILPV